MMQFKQANKTHVTRDIPRIKNFVADGNSGEWEKKGMKIPLFSNEKGSSLSPDNFSVLYHVGWTEKGIAFLAEITDDRIFHHPTNPWLSDGIELFVSKGIGLKDHIHFLVNPGTTEDDLSPEVHYYTVGLDDYSTGKFKFEIKKQQDGYIVEGLIPLTALEIVPGMGERMGLQLYASDVDDLENLRKTTYHWNHFDNSYKNPLGFENIILTGTGEKVNNYAVKAYLEDKEKVHVTVFSSSLKDKAPARILHQGELLSEIPLENAGGYLKGKHGFSVDQLGSKPGLLKIYHGNELLDILDPGLLPLVWTEKPIPNRFEEDIMIFEALDRYHQTDTGGVVFVGSSTIRSWETLDEDMENEKVLNRGFGGSTIGDVLYYLKRIVLPYKPQKLFIYEGDNDLAFHHDPEKFVLQCEELIGRVHDELPYTEIYFISVKPSPARVRLLPLVKQANQKLETLTAQYSHVHFIDIYPLMMDEDGHPREDIFLKDRLHMNRKGYELWIPVMKEAITGDHSQ